MIQHKGVDGRDKHGHDEKRGREARVSMAGMKQWR
jgi:hypothetical protein